MDRFKWTTLTVRSGYGEEVLEALRDQHQVRLSIPRFEYMCLSILRFGYVCLSIMRFRYMCLSILRFEYIPGLEGNVWE